MEHGARGMEQEARSTAHGARSTGCGVVSARRRDENRNRRRATAPRFARRCLSPCPMLHAPCYLSTELRIDWRDGLIVSQSAGVNVF